MLIKPAQQKKSFLFFSYAHREILRNLADPISCGWVVEHMIKDHLFLFSREYFGQHIHHLFIPSEQTVHLK
jgi:hypothetical protein